MPTGTDADVGEATGAGEDVGRRRRRRSTAAARSVGVSSDSRARASSSSPGSVRVARARPARDDRRVRPEERWRRPDHAIVGDRHVDRDVVAADTPRPRRRANPGRRRPRTSTARGRVASSRDRPPACSSCPRTVSSAMIAAISPAVRELIAAATIALEAARWSGRMSRIARPSPRAGRVRPDEALRRLEREGRLGPLGVVQAVQPRSDRGRDLPGRRRHRGRATRARRRCRSRIARLTPSIGTRSWVIESRSRIVTAPSSSDSTSTVTHHGVPISSWRR